jgi:serine-protein kinase ATM
MFLAELIESYRKLSSAYIHLATANVSDLKRNGVSSISLEKVCQTSIHRLDKCLGSGSRKAKCLPCIFTKPPMIRPGCDYGDGINDPIGSERVNTFDESFTITDTGVNQPKIVVCIGTSNGRYRQLVKGSDDTRQDAVMEQVFGYANDILARHRHSTSADVPFSSDHVLRLITYNVVPLNHVAGVSHKAVLHFIFPHAHIYGLGSRMGRELNSIWRLYR